MKTLVPLVVSLLITFLAVFALADLKSQVAYYDDAYKLRTVHAKLVDYNGHYLGPKDHNLKGLKNMKMALNGILYWGGGNNTGRDNRNPLRTEGVDSLCKEGFSTGIYLYTTGFEDALKQSHCTDRQGQANTFNYVAKNSAVYQKAIIEQIYKAIKQERPGPVYMHCWNGLHASNQMAAVALKQFCNYTSEEALQFWRINAEGTDKKEAFPVLMDAIKNFEAYPEFQITEAEKNLICLRHN